MIGIHVVRSDNAPLPRCERSGEFGVCRRCSILIAEITTRRSLRLVSVVSGRVGSAEQKPGRSVGRRWTCDDRRMSLHRSETCIELADDIHDDRELACDVLYGARLRRAHVEHVRVFAVRNGPLVAAWLGRPSLVSPEEFLKAGAAQTLKVEPVAEIDGVDGQDVRRLQLSRQIGC